MLEENEARRRPQRTANQGLTIIGKDMKYYEVDTGSGKIFLLSSLAGMRNGKSAASLCRIHCLSSGER
jgi:hypothetical protein